MATGTVTLFLDGTPTVADYATAIAGFADLLSSITQRLAPGAEVTWEIEDLEAESALTTARGVSAEPEVVRRLAEEFLRIGVQLKTAPFVVGYEGPTRRLRSVLNGRIPRIKFETADDDVTIFPQAEPPPALPESVIIDFGAVEGRVQTLSNRGGLRFTLYDLLYDKAVSCYLAEGSEHMMRDVWGRVALVEGRVKRDPVSGRPVAVRQISRVEPLEEGRIGGWRAAIGAMRGITDGEPAEDSIRRLRDAD